MFECYFPIDKSIQLLHKIDENTPKEIRDKAYKTLYLATIGIVPDINS